jgi:hypothetical protein
MFMFFHHGSSGSESLYKYCMFPLLFSVASFIAAWLDWSLSERTHFFRYVIFSFGSYRGLGFKKSCV